MLVRAEDKLPLLRLAYRAIRSAFYGGAYNGVGLDYLGYPGPNLGYRHLPECSFRRGGVRRGQRHGVAAMTRSLTHSLRFAWLVLLAGALVASCGGGEGGADGGFLDALDDALEVSDGTRSEVVDAFELARLPHLVRECGACHDLAALAEL